MSSFTNPTILTEDVVRIDKYQPNAYYDPVHLLQMAHNAHLETRYAIHMRKREWEAFLKDGDEGGNGKFEIFTVWSDHSDCMDVLTTTIYYNPRSAWSEDYTFAVTQSMLAISLANGYRISSPLFHCTTEEELRAFLDDDDETPFKRYLNLEHIMERLRESEEGQATIRHLEREQEEKQKAEQAQEQTASKPKLSPENLYSELCEPLYRNHPYEIDDLDEGMKLVKESIDGWWKPRFLIDENAHSAYELMDDMLILQTVTDDDIDWDSLAGIPLKALERAKAHSGLFPTLVYRFRNGEANVTWQINPDGRYYMDDNGFGMTDDDEIALHGTIDRTGHVIKKFCYKG